jgi:hypothetical protein
MWFHRGRGGFLSQSPLPALSTPCARHLSLDRFVARLGTEWTSCALCTPRPSIRRQWGRRSCTAQSCITKLLRKHGFAWYVRDGDVRCVAANGLLGLSDLGAAQCRRVLPRMGTPVSGLPGRPAWPCNPIARSGTRIANARSSLEHRGRAASCSDDGATAHCWLTAGCVERTPSGLVTTERGRNLLADHHADEAFLAGHRDAMRTGSMWAVGQCIAVAAVRHDRSAPAQVAQLAVLQGPGLAEHRTPSPLSRSHAGAASAAPDRPAAAAVTRDGCRLAWRLGKEATEGDDPSHHAGQ